MIADIAEPVSDTDFQQYYDLRYRMLRQPWGQPPGSERDELEAIGYHLMARMPNQAIVACGRLHVDEFYSGRIRYMAVEHAFQRAGLGSRILEKLEIRAQLLGCDVIELHARETCTEFYLRRDYVICGRGPLMFGSIPHSLMRKAFGKTQSSDDA